jgi:hypothetical protein
MMTIHVHQKHKRIFLRDDEWSMGIYNLESV